MDLKCYKFNLKQKMRRFFTFLSTFFLVFTFLFLSYCTNQKKTLATVPEKPPSTGPGDQILQKDKNGEHIPASEESSVQEKQKPAEILEDALDAYQDARNAWEKADIETAMAALDEAYSLILKLELPQDSPLIQEKNDLRLLIAQRIQEIYATHLIAIGNNHRTIPLPENKFVKAEIKNFQNGEKTYFENAYRRSGRYIQMIRKEMKKEGLPEELAWIPVIESGFKVRAYSRARALGLWQFIASTGYRFGLKRDRWIDERMDPEKATRAAVKYLSELHSFFGDWTTALASYNCGEFRIQRLIRAQRINYFDNFWDLFTMLPRETARFVPRFIATL